MLHHLGTYVYTVRCFTKHVAFFISRLLFCAKTKNAPDLVHQCFSTTNTSNISTVRQRIDTMAKRQFEVFLYTRRAIW